MRALNVFTTNVNIKPLSKLQLMRWVCEATHYPFHRVECLGTGVVYCVLLHKLFPGVINNRKIRYDGRNERNRIHNFKLVQEAFNALKIDKTVPIESLVNCRLRDNLHFLQWFKVFYDVNSALIVNPGMVCKQRSSSVPLQRVRQINNDLRIKRAITHEGYSEPEYRVDRCVVLSSPQNELMVTKSIITRQSAGTEDHKDKKHVRLQCPECNRDIKYHSPPMPGQDGEIAYDPYYPVSGSTYSSYMGNGPAAKRSSQSYKEGESLQNLQTVSATAAGAGASSFRKMKQCTECTLLNQVDALSNKVASLEETNMFLADTVLNLSQDSKLIFKTLNVMFADKAQTNEQTPEAIEEFE